MSMTRIAKYMYVSGTIDLTRGKDRFFRLPEGEMHRTVLMTEKQAASFSSACSCRVIRSLRAT